MNSPLKVVVVINNPLVSRIAKVHLRRAGYNVFLFSYAVEACDEILKKKWKPDVLISEALVPGMSGFELLARLNAEKIFPKSYILVQQSFEKEIVDNLKFADVTIITKPFDPILLTAELERKFHAAA